MNGVDIKTIFFFFGPAGGIRDHGRVVYFVVSYLSSSGDQYLGMRTLLILCTLPADNSNKKNSILRRVPAILCYYEFGEGARFPSVYLTK